MAIRWNRVIQPYLKSTQILICPSESLTANFGGTYNYHGLARDTNSTAAGIMLAAIQLPSQSPVLAEAAGYSATAQMARNNDPNNPQCMVFITPSSPVNSGRDVDPPTGTWTSLGNETAIIRPDRHFDGSNYLFADGHVKWLHYRRVSVRETVSTAPIPADTLVSIPSDGLDWNFDGIVGDAKTVK